MSSALLWLQGFGLTLAVEEVVAVPLLGKVEASLVRRALAVLVANLATHPLVWFFFPYLGWSWTQMACGAEAWAFGFEIVAYRLIFPEASWRRCTIVSLAANAGSLLVGLFAARWGLLH